MKEQRFLTVHALTKYIKRKFDADPHLQDIFVKGEISNYKQHSSGHMYFTLKDEKARILAVMFSSSNRFMKFSPENGMKVLVKGDITVYESSGQYQMYIKEMRPDGVGELYLAYEQLKEKLQKEGLFSPQYKKSIPKYPHTVGVITSPTGAAIRDVLTTLKRRYPIASVILIPALVQGEQAAPSIAKAIAMANGNSEIDVLIVGRGGGSIEELWAFNEEIVARTIFESRIPVISAVGHETDYTIADFVADMRAPTPTAAAELAVPHIDDLMERIMNRQTRLLRAMKEKVAAQNQRLNRMQKSYAFRYPQRLYEQKIEQVDKRREQLVKGAQKLFVLKSEQHRRELGRLNRVHPRELLSEAVASYKRSNRSLKKALGNIHANKQKDLHSMLTTLEALSPLKIMNRGYSLVYKDDGQLVKSIAAVKKDESIEVKMADGYMHCRIMDIKESENSGS
ncbi:exodeoxyribonuclease VII large subunit [Bacillus canaveralius]|uniref:Exodeoxyribonuclease 7 large subunit n=1 Tax=Bacillus canaveralius TaxID=1403243 RepID=A0A2N5GRU8_9BACI|nr:exodeoxyribonuclease VII large subunit [Bacillus canaveralius]PLR86159.1 exodeoxyribonuclease VII large subunit [Bacillus canaveralius]PLS00280.1 exodeoxyribonuclease VII large subunit [Bacillus canaveralius]